MKIIKFRSAHYTFKGDFSHFSYWGEIDHKGDLSKDCFVSPSSSSTTNREFEDQYVGRIDNKGNEIFEGDIVNADGLIAPVIYSDLWCEFRLVGGFSVGWYADIEVIDNVHQKEKES